MGRSQSGGKFFSWIQQFWWQVALPGFYFVGMFLYHPFRKVIWLDSDEGINLVKAQMLLRGYALYSEIWNDQPPLFTYLLAGFLRTFGQRINVGRLLVLLLSCGVIFLCLHFLYQVWGKWHALVGGILLLILPRFIGLSVSVMIGLPSIALALLSLVALVYWHKSNHYFWLVLSGLGLGASMMVKLFTGFLAPVFLLGILAAAYTRQRDLKKWRKILQPGVVWGGAVALVVGLTLLFLVRPLNIGQLLEVHLTASQDEVYRSDPTVTLAFHLYEARLVLILALLGLLQAVISRRWLALYPAAWMMTAFILLSLHTPVWTHQQLLVTIPAAILAAGAVGDAFERGQALVFDKARWERWDYARLVSFAVFAGTLLMLVPAAVSASQTAPEYYPSWKKDDIVERLQQYAPQTEWFVTDLTIYAFYVDLPVPPELVVFSSKRIETGYLTESDFLRVILEYQPEQVLLGRCEYPTARLYLMEHYQLVYRNGSLCLYLTNRLAPAEVGSD